MRHNDHVLARRRSDATHAFPDREKTWNGHEVRRSFKKTARRILCRGALIAATLGLGLHLMIANLSRTAHSVPEQELKNYIVKHQDDEPYWRLARGVTKIFFFSVNAGKETAQMLNSQTGSKNTPIKGPMSLEELGKRLAVNLIFGEETASRDFPARHHAPAPTDPQ